MSPTAAAVAAAAEAAAALQQRLAARVPAAAAAAASQAQAQLSKLGPKLALLACAGLWGSYPAAVRLLYETPAPPDAAVVMAARGTLQAAALIAVSLAAAGAAEQQQPQQQQQQQQGEQEPSVPALPSSSSGSSSSGGEGAPSEPSASTAGSGGDLPLLERWLFLKSPPLWCAALELGLWNYSATALQTVGLQLVGATRASFLVQATVLLTPLLSLAAGYRPGRRVWGASALALAGCLLITADEASAGVGGAAAAAAAGGEGLLHLGGDSAILAAALFYSLAVVRTTGYARCLPPVQLATGKSVVLGSLAVGSLALAAAGAAADGGAGLAALWGGYADLGSWAALGWAGLGPGATASFLHAAGQRHVPPAEAQVLFSSKPLWAAGLAWLLLGGEQLGPSGWAGGAALAVAGLVASTGSGGSGQDGGQDGGGQRGA